MKFLNWESHILAFKVDGKITKADIDEAARRMKSMLERHNRINMYCKIMELEGYEVEAFFDDLKLSLENWENFDKAAIVSERSWIEKFADFIADIGNIEIKVFEKGKEDEARGWLKSPAKTDIEHTK